jgi:hypothetical protein
MVRLACKETLDDQKGLIIAADNVQVVVFLQKVRMCSEAIVNGLCVCVRYL